MIKFHFEVLEKNQLSEINSFKIYSFTAKIFSENDTFYKSKEKSCQKLT